MLKIYVYGLFLLLLLVTACSPAAVEPTNTPTPLPPTSTATPTLTPTKTPTPRPTLTPTPSYPPGGMGPMNFPSNVDPLTGMEVTNPALLERRPLAIKVENIPRDRRPQWGLSYADIVFEYYTEEGSTRFISIFYGQDAEMVGQIRSARLMDIHVVRGYKAVFAYGSGSEYITSRLNNSEFADRLVTEFQNRPVTGTYSPLWRYEPNGMNRLVANTSTLSTFITDNKIENGRQDLNGMFFKLEAPAGGQPAEHIFTRFSAAIYNRWDYDAATAKYLRFSDTADDLTNGLNEGYLQLTDKLTGQPIAFDNIVVLLVTYVRFSQQSEIWDIQLAGSGTAYAFRDEQVYKVNWQRKSPDGIVTLTYEDGTPFPFKPGTTWFEVMGAGTLPTQNDQGWRFVHKMP